MTDEVANVALTKVVPTETTITPYYDDFDENKNFNRILFKPGYAVQARELTQMQTILQNQIERFGSHVFTDGSIVHGGQTNIDYRPRLNLEPQYISTDVFANNFVGKIITDTSGNTTYEATVIAGAETNTVGRPVLAIAYRSGESFTGNQTIKVLDEEIYANTTANSNTSLDSCTIATINDGVFYFNGYFVKKPKQTIIVDPFSTRANAKVGIEFTEEIISADDDLTLLDPAQESSNYQGPGADRLKITLNFTTRALDSEDEENFIELIRLQEGNIVQQTRYPIYSELAKEFARRTYDESGSYTVSPFRVRTEEHPTDDTKLRLVIEPGKAYVRGYELETIAPYRIDIDKARDTTSVNNIDVAAQYGNSTIVDNVNGVIDISTMPMVDLHCVPSANVDTTSNTTYQRTKIGTARVRGYEYYSASNTQNTQTHTYDVSFFDLRYRNITSNVSSQSSSNTIIIYDNGNFTSEDNAYAGGTIRFTSGAANGASYGIVSYNALTKSVVVDDDIVGTLTNSDNISIDSSFAIVESVYTDATYTPDATTTYYANINSANRNASGYTYLSDPFFTPLVFKLPYKYIKEGSISDQQYQYSRTFNGVSFAAGTATIFVNPSREAFNGAGGSGTSSSVLDNFIVVNSATGAIVRLDNVTINAVTGVATLTSGTLTATCTVIAKVNLNDGPNVNEKSKALYTGNTEYFSTATSSATLVSADIGSTIDVYLNDGQALITDPSKTANERQSLHVSDVRRVTKIYDMEGITPSAGASLASCLDVTNRFYINNGQRDSFYDYASIQLKPKAREIQGPLLVVFDWYDHIAGDGDDLGYFSVDSYPDVDTSSGYTDIPIYTSTQGIKYDLRDCIDFRPRRKNLEALGPDYELEGIRIPAISENFGCDLQYYLARNDLLVVTKDANPPFILQSGKSDVKPAYPKSIAGSMPIYKIQIDAYTPNKNHVSLIYVENKRYTMRDIGLLEKRIENLEYYASLSVLEKTATDMLIKDPNGLDRTKNGIIVDNFMTHGIGNVFSPDYFMAMDKFYGAATPPQNAVNSPLTLQTKTNTKKSDRLVTLDYTEEPAIIQPYATKFIPVTPYARSVFVGSLSLTPPGDFWVETTKAPDLIVNNFGENDNIALGPDTGCAPDQNDEIDAADNPVNVPGVPGVPRRPIDIPLWAVNRNWWARRDR